MDYSNLYAFLEECCKEQNIDESYGVDNAKACMEWARKVMDADKKEDKEGKEDKEDKKQEERFILYCTALYRMCDKKYGSPLQNTIKIHSFLLKEGWSPATAEECIAIINTISYSKLKRACSTNQATFPEMTEEHAYRWHIVRHAHLLEDYNVGRSMLFLMNRIPDGVEEDLWKLVETRFRNRVFLYVKDGWIFLPKAIEYANMLEEKAYWNLVERGCPL